MRILDSLSLQLAQKVSHVEVLQGQHFLVIFICGVEPDDQFVIHIEDLRVVVQLLTRPSNQVEFAKGLIKIRIN